MSGISVQQVIADFFEYAPKLAAFEAGTPVSLPIPAASYTVAIPDIGTIDVQESGTTVTITKKA